MAKLPTYSNIIEMASLKLWQPPILKFGRLGPRCRIDRNNVRVVYDERFCLLRLTQLGVFNLDLILISG